MELPINLRLIIRNFSVDIDLVHTGAHCMLVNVNRGLRCAQ